MSDNEVIKGSISDLIFRIETISSDRDTIKVCVRAAAELAQMQVNDELRRVALADALEKMAAKDEALRLMHKTLEAIAKEGIVEGGRVLLARLALTELALKAIP